MDVKQFIAKDVRTVQVRCFYQRNLYIERHKEAEEEDIGEL